jgi:hypothetical protein
MKKNTAALLSLIACFLVVFFALTPSLSVASIVLPVVMDDQGFNVTITYYYISGPNTIVLVGSVESPDSLTLRSLTGIASIDGVNVGSGTVDQPYIQLTSGVAAPVSATVTTKFDIYNALWFGQIDTGDGRTIPFYYDSTPVTVVLTGQLCIAPQGTYCFPWPDFNQTSTLSLL